MGARAFNRPALWKAYLAFGVVGMCLYLLDTAAERQPGALQHARPDELDRRGRRHPPQQARATRCRGGCSRSGSSCTGWATVYTYSYPKYILHGEVPFPSIGDAIYLTVYPAQMLGLLLLVRRRNPQRNRNTLIDAAILTLGLSLLSWILQIAPYIHDGSTGPAAQARVGRLSARATSSCSPPRSAWCSTAVAASRPSTC